MQSCSIHLSKKKPIYLLSNSYLLISSIITKKCVYYIAIKQENKLFIFVCLDLFVQLL